MRPPRVFRKSSSGTSAGTAGTPREYAAPQLHAQDFISPIGRPEVGERFLPLRRPELPGVPVPLSLCDGVLSQPGDFFPAGKRLWPFYCRVRRPNLLGIVIPLPRGYLEI